MNLTFVRTVVDNEETDAFVFATVHAMMATTPRDPTTDPKDTGKRGAFPVTSALAAAGAAFAYGGCAYLVNRIGGRIGGEAGWGVLVLGISALLMPLRFARVFAVLLLWNGLGVVLASLLLGITGSGAIMIFPVVLIALALSSAPIEATAPIGAWPATTVLVVGFLAAIAVAEGFPFSGFTL
jgi:hypothetical protein